MTERLKSKARPIATVRIERSIRALVVGRAPASVCPSEVARALDAVEWRPLMARVRAVAGKMAKRGKIAITQRGRTVDVATARGPVRFCAVRSPASYADAYRGIDFRTHPELYRVGRGEQGVLVAEPYRSELLPLWRFRTPAMARASCAALWKAFVGYRRSGDFVGMDMTRKFIQMGYTRARRYARHRSGRKYDAAGLELPQTVDREKAASAEIFRSAWQRVNADRIYRAMREAVRRRAKAPSRERPQPRGVEVESTTFSPEVRPRSPSGTRSRRDRQR